MSVFLNNNNSSEIFSTLQIHHVFFLLKDRVQSINVFKTNEYPGIGTVIPNMNQDLSIRK